MLHFVDLRQANGAKSVEKRVICHMNTTYSPTPDVSHVPSCASTARTRKSKRSEAPNTNEVCRCIAIFDKTPAYAITYEFKMVTSYLPVF